LQDAIGVNVKGDFNLWNTTWSRWNTAQLKLAQFVVVLGTCTLTLIDLNQYTRLVVSISGKDFALLGWDSCVTLNQRSHNTTGSLDTHGQWSDIQQQQVLSLLASVTTQNGGLNSGTVSNSLIGVYTFVWLFAVEEVRHQLLDLWNTSRTSNQNNLVNVALVNLGVT